MLQHLIERETRSGIRGENGANEHASLMTDEVILDRKTEVVLTNIGVCVVHIPTVVGCFADQHRVGDHSDRPDVDFIRIGALVVGSEDLGSNVVRSATHGLLAFIWLVELGRQPEITHLHLQIFIQKDIAQLQISVDDASAVQIFYSVDDLQKKVLDFGLRQTLAILY